ncbi:hypothetical protein [Nonomuraea rhizosphaerae]|uniref:hypothetical protein n=1 Tax=Nonomuraea rhizosphaerae TaxID=2665663 RepID=UPI001C5F86DB|nr:hypothetical protein [Nonomuraea rhizosphaerae]
MLGAACSPQKDIVPTPAPAVQPIVDASPYVCEMIPEQALRSVTGVTASLSEKMTGDEKSGECWAPDTTPHPLEVGWLLADNGSSQEQVDYLLAGRRDTYTRHGGVKLPAGLGDGMAAYITNSPLADQPYRVSAKFRCGGKDRLLDIFLAEVVKGRDAIKDMTELMRIAQTRYAQIHNCKPEPLTKGPG